MPGSVAAIYTESEYLQSERSADSKHEYLNGQVVVMAGASERHNIITINMIASLHGQVRPRGCRVFASDMRLYIPDAHTYLYPDIALLCQSPQFRDVEHDTFTNPMVVIEVLSPSTERLDRGQKFASYRLIPTLHEYVLVSQERMLVEHYTRQTDERWLFVAYTHQDTTLQFISVGCQLPLATIYDGIDFA